MRRPFFAVLALLGLGGCHSNDPTTGTTTVSGQVVVYQSGSRAAAGSRCFVGVVGK